MELSPEISEIPPYSSDLEAVWPLVDLICAEGYRLQLEGSKIWQARFYKSVARTLDTRAVLATSNHPATAICLAALNIKGIEPPK